MKLLSILIIISLSNICFADTKFHYGDKVIFTMDFYGQCDGIIDEAMNARSPQLDCSHQKNKTAYEIINSVCNGKDTYKTFLVCESALTKHE